MNTKNLETTREVSSKQTTALVLSLLDLPDDMLFAIFAYCDKQSLGRLCRTCIKFNELASQDCVWLRVTPPLNQTCVLFSSSKRPRNKKIPSFQKRRKETTLKERLRISRNWERNAQTTTKITRHSTRLIPWLKLDGQDLYISKASDIHCYKMQNNGKILEEVKLAGSSCDVTRFVIGVDVLVSGFRGGDVIGYTKDLKDSLFAYNFGECGDTQTVSLHDGVVIAGFRDGSVKMIKTNQYGDEAITDLNITQSLNQVNRVWSSAISPDGSTFSIGNAGHDNNRSPLEVYDFASGKMVHNLGTGWMRGAGILDIKYETPNIILSCGYDTSLRMWDMRTQTCVKKWYEPFDAELSCLQSDCNNVIVTGTFQYGVTRLWDKRLDLPVQLYYCGQKRSPVYSLDTDFKRLFVALDIEVHMLDFSVYEL